MLQHDLIPAGCQQWIRNPTAAHSDQFAYASTLAIYVHRYRGPHSSLQKVIAGQDDRIACLSWHPHNGDLLACATCSPEIMVYSINKETSSFSLLKPKAIRHSITQLSWCYPDHQALLIASGPNLYKWNYMSETDNLVVLNTFKADITFFSQNSQESSTVAAACNDCNVLLLEMSQNRMKKRMVLDQSAADIQFDPFSTCYMLICFKNGEMAMYDTGSCEQVKKFAKQNPAERRICFVPGAPGTFLTISDRSSVISTWNVSQDACIGTFKTGIGPCLSLSIIPDSKQALVTFIDGTVAIFDVPKKSLIWKTNGGHTETVFDCSFSPSDNNTLATCSFDGTVRIWNVRTMSCEKITRSINAILYSIAWSPDGQQLAASDSKGRVHVYNAQRGVVVKQLQHHDVEAKVFRIVWNPDPEIDLIASVSDDGTCVIFNSSGTMERILRHGAGGRGAAWNKIQPNLLATSCVKGNIFIWDMDMPADGCLLKALPGHRLCVFNVQWSPFIPNWLLSGSDDSCAKVWDTSSGKCTADLKGHVDKTRGLLWHSALENLVITGSWDATIRLWDIRDASCVACLRDHQADVYGITSHPQRPFLIVTCSRDTTFRFWNLLGLFPGLLVTRMQEEHALPSRHPKGWMVKNNSFTAVENSAQSVFERTSSLSKYYLMPGIEDIWTLAGILTAQKGSQQHYGSCAFWFHSEILKAIRDKAQQKELSSDMKTAAVGVTRTECMKEAAALHLQSGNFLRYCELMIELKEWDKAITVAPSVSLEYWRKLMRRKADWILEQSDASPEMVSELLLPSGHASSLVGILMRNKSYENAFITATIDSTGGYGGSKADSNGHQQACRMSVMSPCPSMDRQMQPCKTLKEIRLAQASHLFQGGKPIEAACCHLSVEDVQGALHKLWMGNELEVIVTLRLALGLDRDLEVEYQLARKCEAAGDWWAAGNLLKAMPDGGSHLELLAARIQNSGESADVVETFKQDFGVTPLEEGDTAEGMVRQLLMRQNHIEACTQLLEMLHSSLKDPEWSSKLHELKILQQCISSADLNALEKRQRTELQAYDCFLGALRAFNDGYCSIGQFLMDCTRRYIRREDLDFPLPIHQIFIEEGKGMMQFNASSAEAVLAYVVESGSVAAQEQAKQLLNDLGTKSKDSTFQREAFVVTPSSSQMPSRSYTKQYISSVTGAPILGPVVFVKHLDSQMSAGESAALSRVVSLWMDTPT